VTLLGTPHFQGYVRFPNPRTLAGVIVQFPAPAPSHWTLVTTGTEQRCIDYCRKVDDPTFIDGPYEYGTVLV